MIAALAAGAWLGTRAGTPPAHGMALMFGPSPAAGDTDELADLVSRLGSARDDAREQLAGAARPADQAVAARSLERLYRLAATRVDPSLAAALSACAAAYRQLATAASARDRRAYARAARRVDAAERALQRAVAAQL